MGAHGNLKCRVLETCLESLLPLSMHLTSIHGSQQYPSRTTHTAVSQPIQRTFGPRHGLEVARQPSTLIAPYRLSSTWIQGANSGD